MSTIQISNIYNSLNQKVEIKPPSGDVTGLGLGVSVGQQTGSGIETQVSNPNVPNPNANNATSSVAVANQDAEAVDNSNPFNQPFNTGAGGANPFDKSPVFIATTHDPDPNKPANNPNARNAAAVNDPKQTGNPKSEINQGGSKPHTITNIEIKELEIQTNLTLYPYLFGGELARIRHQFSGLNRAKYYLLLNMLVYGFDNKILESGAYGSEKCVIDQAFLDDFLRMAKIPQLQEAIKKTPAYGKGSFDELGKLGTTQANASHLDESPITGPSHEHPNLLTALMEKIHPGAIAKLEAYCNKVRTSAYMSLPKRAFASLQKLVAGINKVIASFAKIISDIYNGIMYYIQQFFALINGIIAKIQQLLMMVIESIIPMDLMCLISLILGKALNDIPFFSSIMNMSNILNQATGGLQSYISQALGGAGGGIAAFANNPFAAVSRFLPPQVNQIIQQVNSFASNPDAFLSTAITNYGYALAAKQSQGQIYNLLTQKLGSNFAAMHPIASFLGANGAGNPQTPSQLGPTITDDGKNVYSQPVSSADIPKNTPGGGTSEATAAGLANSNFGAMRSKAATDAIATRTIFDSGLNPAANYIGTQ
jgi:hypothetical protein